MTYGTNDEQITAGAIRRIKLEANPRESITLEDVENEIAEVLQTRWASGLSSECDDPQTVVVNVCDHFGVDYADMV